MKLWQVHSTADDAIVTQGLTRRFGDLLAVDHLDLVVPHGAVFGLLSSSGSSTGATRSS